MLLGDGDSAAECVLTSGGISTKRDVFHRVSLRFHPVGGIRRGNFREKVRSNYHASLGLISHTFLGELVLRGNDFNG